MPINTVAEQRIFKGAVCPYTGKPVTVRVVALDGKEPMFFSPDAFDPSVPVESLKELLLKAGTRDGLMGALTDEKALVCPYTGNRMSVAKTGSGLFFLRGGFRPSCPVKGAVRFNHQLRMRNGVSDAEPPAAVSVSMSAREPPPEKECAGQVVSHDDALAFAEEVIKNDSAFVRKTTVSMSAASPRGRKVRENAGKL